MLVSCNHCLNPFLLDFDGRVSDSLVSSWQIIHSFQFVTVWYLVEVDGTCTLVSTNTHVVSN